MTWFSIIISGIVTYFSRMAMVALIDRDMLSSKVKEVLNYVPAAVFPAIIFPGIFLIYASLISGLFFFIADE